MAKVERKGRETTRQQTQKGDFTRAGSVRRTKRIAVTASDAADASGMEEAAKLRDLEPAESPTMLARTLLYRTLPVRVRSQLDQAILHRPPQCATLEAIAAKFQLTERYKISLDALQTYANRLEQYARPAVTSQLMAGILGCLPEQYRRQLIAGNQILLLSRIMQALSTESDTALPVSDLVKLAGALTAMSRRAAARSCRPSAREKNKDDSQSPPDLPKNVTQPTKLAEAVRMIYGLTWPPSATDDLAESNQHRPEHE